MTPEDLFRKVCAIVDETEVSGSQDKHSRTVVQLGLTLCAAGLRALPEKNRERLLPNLTAGVEKIHPIFVWIVGLLFACLLLALLLAVLS